VLRLWRSAERAEYDRDAEDEAGSEEDDGLLSTAARDCEDWAGGVGWVVVEEEEVRAEDIGEEEEEEEEAEGRAGLEYGPALCV